MARWRCRCRRAGRAVPVGVRMRVEQSPRVGVAPGAQGRRGHLLPVASQLQGRARRSRRRGRNAGITRLPALQLVGRGRPPVRRHGRADQLRRQIGQNPRPAILGRPHEVVRARDRLDATVASRTGDCALQAGGQGVQPVHHVHPPPTGARRAATVWYQPAATRNAGLRPNRRGEPSPQREPSHDEVRARQARRPPRRQSHGRSTPAPRSSPIALRRSCGSVASTPHSKCRPYMGSTRCDPKRPARR